MEAGRIESFSAAKTPSIASYADIHVRNSGYKTIIPPAFRYIIAKILTLSEKMQNKNSWGAASQQRQPVSARSKSPLSRG